MRPRTRWTDGRAGVRRRRPSLCFFLIFCNSLRCNFVIHCMDLRCIIYDVFDLRLNCRGAAGAGADADQRHRLRPEAAGLALGEGAGLRPRDDPGDPGPAEVGQERERRAAAGREVVAPPRWMERRMRWRIWNWPLFRSPSFFFIFCDSLHRMDKITSQ